MYSKKVTCLVSDQYYLVKIFPVKWNNKTMAFSFICLTQVGTQNLTSGTCYAHVHRCILEHRHILHSAHTRDRIFQCLQNPFPANCTVKGTVVSRTIFSSPLNAIFEPWGVMGKLLGEAVGSCMGEA